MYFNFGDSTTTSKSQQERLEAPHGIGFAIWVGCEACKEHEVQKASQVLASTARARRPVSLAG